MAEHFISAQRAEGNEHRTLSQPRENHGLQSAALDCWGPPKNFAPSPIGASRENAGATRPTGSGDSSLFESGAKAIDTQREAKEVQGTQRLELGIALSKGGDPFGQILNSIQALPVEQRAQVTMTGASAFSGAISDQARQVMHGIHDGTGAFGEDAINTVGKVGNAAIGLARFETDLENNPVKAGGEILETGTKAARTAERLSWAAHQGLDAARHYYRDAVSGKVQPLDDAQRIAMGGVKAASEAYQRWDAQPTYDKTRQAVEGSWTFAVPNMLEGIAALKAAGTPEAEAGLTAIQNRLENIQAVFDKYDKRSENFMPEVPQHLRHLELQKASPELLQAIERKGRLIHIVAPGSTEYKKMQEQEVAGIHLFNAEDGTHHISMKENPNKITALEEFLHGTQVKLGLLSKSAETERLLPQMAEIHVKDFMIRHAQLLRLNENDLTVLKWLKQDEIQRLNKMGYTWTGE